jgi:hypothetical protein
LRFPFELLELGLMFHLLGKCRIGEDAEGWQVTSGEGLLIGDEGTVP